MKVILVCSVESSETQVFVIFSIRSVSQCLSARQGWYSLLRADQPVLGVDLSALYGLHCFAFFFVVMGHRFGSHFMLMHVTNYRSVEKMFVDSWFSIWADHVDLFVDIFFFMSAFLVSILYYAQLHKRYVSPLKVYFYRLCRLVPTYAVVVFFYATLLRQLGNGPIWNMFMNVEQGACRQNWWANLLFINTYVNTDNMCLLQSWYISCDFQLFVVATLLVFLLQRQKRLGLFVIAVVFVASTLAAFFGTYLYDRAPTLLFFKDFWTNPRHHDLFTSVYSQGHYRGTSYVMGLLAGCYAYEHRNHPINKRWTWTLQLAGFICCLVVYWSGSLFHDRSEAHSRLLDALYAATFHSVFGLGLALLIVACTVGHTRRLVQYADDTTLCLNSKSQEEIFHLLRQEFELSTTCRTRSKDFMAHDGETSQLVDWPGKWWINSYE
ncbi:hypothetical protein J6590_006380 [Homalodisca vitripennis]|nr:hypothetical protein J6590_006380 [Homalodisca vitripennis]